MKKKPHEVLEKLIAFKDRVGTKWLELLKRLVPLKRNHELYTASIIGTRLHPWKARV